MKKFMLLHIGFEQPTPEIMDAWKAWFADVNGEHCGFMGGREITADGASELPWGPDAMTGYSLIEAESMDAAIAIAKSNPFITAIRVYEIREHAGG